MNNLETAHLQNTLAELAARMQKQDETIKMIGELHMNVAQTVMSHHIAIKALISAVEKSYPDVTKNLRQNIDVQYATASSEEVQAALRKVIALLRTHG